MSLRIICGICLFSVYAYAVWVKGSAVVREWMGEDVMHWYEAEGAMRHEGKTLSGWEFVRVPRG